MFAHYLSIAFRHLRKNKFYSAISVAGLALGLASVFLIYQYLLQETGYDRFHDSAENIYRIVWFDAISQTRTPHPLAMAMVRDFPEVESGVSLTPIFGEGMIRQTFSIRNLEKDIRYDESNVLAVDTNFFRVFSFPLVRGNPETVLKNPGGMLISESMAKKYFGNEDPIGKQLAVNDDRNLLQVIGVFKDVPKNSHFHFDILVSYLRMKMGERGDFFTWKDFGHYNYIKLRPGADPRSLEARIPNWITKYLPWSQQDLADLKRQGYGFRLQPVTSIHLHSNLHWELESNGHISYVYMISAAGLLILVIACLNFINLTTAQSTERAKEIGIRKSLGAFRRQLSSQFIGECLLTAGIGLLISYVLIEAALPFYNRFTTYPVELHYQDFLLLASAAGLAGLFAGTYPAMYLSALKPGLILKGKFIQGPKGSLFRKSFMVFQFFAAMVLISCSLVIVNQLHFIKNKSLGFNENEVVVLPIKNSSAINPRLDELRTELLRIPGIVSVGATSNIPGKPFDQNAISSVSNPDNRVDASEMVVDYDVFKTLGISVKDGRTFARENPADAGSFVINETAARNIYPEGAVGKEIIWDDEDGAVRGTIIGVVRDFHFQSLHNPVRPLLFILKPNYNYVTIRIITTEFDQTIKAVEKTWKKFDDKFDFEFSFLSDQLNQQYKAEQNMASVMIVFAALAIVITCIGLLGIAALTFRQKIKEVSVRKILGASLMDIAYLLLKNFTQLVTIAILVAVPVSFWLMRAWLRNFTFRTSIQPTIFILSGIVLIVITWGTLGYLTWKMSHVNPSETLRAE